MLTNSDSKQRKCFYCRFHQSLSHWISHASHLITLLISYIGLETFSQLVYQDDFGAVSPSNFPSAQTYCIMCLKTLLLDCTIVSCHRAFINIWNGEIKYYTVLFWLFVFSSILLTGLRLKTSPGFSLGEFCWTLHVTIYQCKPS